MRTPALGETGLVYVTSDDGALTAFDAKSGKQVWRQPAFATSPPLVVNAAAETVYVAGADGAGNAYLTAFDGKSGAPIWQDAEPNGGAASAPAAAGGAIFVAVYRRLRRECRAQIATSGPNFLFTAISRAGPPGG